MKNITFKKALRSSVTGLPLAGILFGSLLPLSIFGRQALMLALLIWLQVYLLFDVFLGGK